MEPIKGLSGEYSITNKVSCRDPNMFITGELHNRVDAGNFILQEYQDKKCIFWDIFLGAEGQHSGLFQSFQGSVPEPPVLHAQGI